MSTLSHPYFRSTNGQTITFPAGTQVGPVPIRVDTANADYQAVSTNTNVEQLDDDTAKQLVRLTQITQLTQVMGIASEQLLSIPTSSLAVSSSYEFLFQILNPKASQRLFQVWAVSGGYYTVGLRVVDSSSQVWTSATYNAAVGGYATSGADRITGGAVSQNNLGLATASTPTSQIKYHVNFDSGTTGNLGMPGDVLAVYITTPSAINANDSVEINIKELVK